MIRVGLVGATGYGGRELLRLLLNHPDAEFVAAASTSAVGERVSNVLPGFRGLTDVVFEDFNADSMASRCDVVFIGVPGTQSMDTGAALRMAGARVIDMGPDFRLLNLDEFKTYYKTDHSQSALLNERIYGMVPLYREALKTATLVAVPGCYPLSTILPLKPLVATLETDVPVIVDAISGISGAGKSLNEAFHFPEMNENVRAYKLAAHQHTPEMEQELDRKVQIQFNPHVGPYTRGILATITVRPKNKLDLAALYQVYQDEPFVRVLGEGTIPDLNQVHGTNFCDFGWVNDARTGNLIIVSAIDNLVGGTAGMAIQCMNVMFGINEMTGLKFGGNDSMKFIEGGITAAAGFKASGVYAGIKKNPTKLDCALIVSSADCAVAGVFTKNLMKSPPVFWNIDVCSRGTSRAVFINSGNANAATGQRGHDDVRTMAQMVANGAPYSFEEVCICSTGVIGVPLPMEKIENGIDDCIDKLSEHGSPYAAKAILTTDTVIKERAVEIELGGKTVRLGAIAKGSGMMLPNMAPP